MDIEHKILILGGTNFMGKALLDALQLLPNRSLICCINRGKIYWNNQARKQHPSVLNFYSDRKERKDTTVTVRFVSNHLGINQQNKWTSVIDFSGFKWRDVQSVVKGIKDIAQRYVFISTDSIYNNSDERIKCPITEDSFNIEEEYKLLKMSGKCKDRYGYNKLKCQIYLNRTKPLPFVCLRLPDVIGPYDNTERFWCTLKWVKESNNFPMPITADEENKKLSFVDSLSLADFIAKIISLPDIPSVAYNLSFKEGITLKEFILQGRAAGEQRINFKAEINKNSNHFFPSVECGQISCQKAIRQLGWNPIPFNEVIKKSVEFYLNCGDNYPTQKYEMEKEFKKKVILKND